MNQLLWMLGQSGYGSLSSTLYWKIACLTTKLLIHEPCGPQCLLFSESLPALVMRPITYEPVLSPWSSSININNKIMDVYIREVLPGITMPGDDNNYGSSRWDEHHGCLCTIDVHIMPSLYYYISKGHILPSLKLYSPVLMAMYLPILLWPIRLWLMNGSMLDVSVLQALSKRIHYGMFVAEAKFRWLPW